MAYLGCIANHEAECCTRSYLINVLQHESHPSAAKAERSFAAFLARSAAADRAPSKKAIYETSSRAFLEIA